MKKILSLLLLSTLFACSSHHYRTPSGHGNSLHKARVYFEFLDSGLDEEKKHYEVYAEIFALDPEGIKAVDVLIAGKKKDSAPVIHEDDRYFLKLKVPYHLPIQSTLFQVQMKNGDSRYIELECTRADYCLED